MTFVLDTDFPSSLFSSKCRIKRARVCEVLRNWTGRHGCSLQGTRAGLHTRSFRLLCVRFVSDPCKILYITVHLCSFLADPVHERRPLLQEQQRMRFERVRRHVVSSSVGEAFCTGASEAFRGRRFHPSMPCLSWWWLQFKSRTTWVFQIVTHRVPTLRR